jgi:hypothetical protein
MKIYFDGKNIFKIIIFLDLTTTPNTKIFRETCTLFLYIQIDFGRQTSKLVFSIKLYIYIKAKMCIAQITYCHLLLLHDM